jgi:hypothetical protein
MWCRVVRCFSIGLILLLVSCSVQDKVTSFTASDAADASALATALGDTSVVPCYQAIGGMAAAIAATVPPTPAARVSLGPINVGASAAANPPGLLTEYEVSRAVRGIAQNPACAQIWLDLVNTLLKGAVPGLGALLP